MDNQNYKLRKDKAFPNNNNLSSLHDDGMDLRDYFAAKAMQGLIEALVNDTSVIAYTQITDMSYKVADAMMKAREK